MGLECSITMKWCTRLDETKEADVQKEQKFSFGKWKNRFLQDTDTGNLQNMAMKLEGLEC
jgi:hypothetical protein